MARVSAGCDATPSHYHHHKALLQTRAGLKAAQTATGGFQEQHSERFEVLGEKKNIFFFNKEESQSLFRTSMRASRSNKALLVRHYAQVSSRLGTAIKTARLPYIYKKKGKQNESESSTDFT